MSGNRKVLTIRQSDRTLQVHCLTAGVFSSETILHFLLFALSGALSSI